jgi:membrane-bound lytic murein transglycosylase D
MRLSLVTVFVALAAATSSPSGEARAQAARGPALVLEASANERRAVRGRSLPDLFEAPELASLRAIEARAVGPAAPTTLAGAKLELDLPSGPDVAALVAYLGEAPAEAEDDASEGRQVMMGLLARLSRRRGEVEAALERTGVPRLLVYAALAQSGFAPETTVATGEVGLWRLSPAAAARLGLAVGFWEDERRDPVRSTEAVGRWLALEQARLGSWAAALASVGAGSGHGPVAEAAGRRLVARTHALALVGENRETLGFPAPPRVAAPSPFELVEVPGAVTLGTVARAAGTTIEVLRALNPSLLRDRTPPDEARSLRVPAGTASACGLALPGLLGPTDRVTTHRLRVGDSLDDLAARHGVTARELRRLNGARDATELRGGTTVVLPLKAWNPAAPLPAEASDPAADAADATGPLLAAVPARDIAVPDRERAFYRTCDGDTLAELAQVFGVSEGDIVGWNNLDPSARLQARMVLQLFLPAGLAREGVALLAPEQLRVVTLGTEEFHALDAARRGKRRVPVTARAGDTLVKIARRLGLAPGDLARVNRLAWWAELPEGRPLVVYTSAAPPREVAVGRAVATKRPPLALPPPKAATWSRPGKRAPAAKPAARPTRR